MKDEEKEYSYFVIASDDSECILCKDLDEAKMKAQKLAEKLIPHDPDIDICITKIVLEVDAKVETKVTVTFTA